MTAQCPAQESTSIWLWMHTCINSHEQALQSVATSAVTPTAHFLLCRRFLPIRRGKQFQQQQHRTSAAAAAAVVAAAGAGATGANCTQAQAQADEIQQVTGRLLTAAAGARAAAAAGVLAAAAAGARHKSGK
jgi:hypothetical protein